MRQVQIRFATALLLAALLPACDRGQDESADTGAQPAAPAAAQDASPPATPAPSPAPLDPAAVQMTQMAKLGGGLHASADLCGLATDPAAHAAARASQRDAAVASGALSPVAFDQAFDAGMAEARGAFARASAADRERACGEMRALQQAGPQGGASAGG